MLKTLARKINNLLSRGKLLELKTDTKVPLAKVGLMAQEIYDGIEYPQDFGLKSFPPKDSETLTLHFGGNRNHASVIRAFDKNLIPEDLEEGETCIYNAFNTKILLNKDGDVIITTTSQVTIDAPIVAITGDLLVDGTINGVEV